MNLFARLRDQHTQADEELIVRHLGDALAATNVEHVEPELSLIEHNVMSVDKVLAKLRGQEEQLEQLIAERTERLRQTKISIAAFNLALVHLEQGK